MQIRIHERTHTTCDGFFPAHSYNARCTFRNFYGRNVQMDDYYYALFTSILRAHKTTENIPFIYKFTEYFALHYILFLFLSEARQTKTQHIFISMIIIIIIFFSISMGVRVWFDHLRRFVVKCN